MRRPGVSFWANNGPRYTGVIVWTGFNIYLMSYTYQQYKYSPQFFYLHEMLGAGLCWSRGTAAVINLNLGVLLLPMCRTITTLLRRTGAKVPMRTFWILMNHCKGFHVLCSYIVVLASVAHFFGHCFNAENYSQHYNVRFKGVNAAQKPKENPVLIVIRSVPGVTGLVMLVLLSMIVSSAVYAVRSSSYDTFWYIHRLSFVFYILGLVHAVRGILKRQSNLSRHTPGCVYMNSTDPLPQISDWRCLEDPVFDTIGSSTWLWTAVPLCLYMGDLVFRTINRQHNVATVRGATPIHEHILELHIHKQGFHCRPGQYVLLQCPYISALEWHPFTVTEVPATKGGGEFTLHVKTSGDWSGKLRNYLLGEMKSSDTDLLLGDKIAHRLCVDGPFGSPMEDVLKYKVCVCIAGGIGITPFIALLNYMRIGEHTHFQRLYLIWICKDARICVCFARIICDIFAQFWNKNQPDVFNVQIHVTAADTPIQADTFEEHSLLKRRIYFGRPNWSSFMCKVATAFPSCNVGVFCCGPKSLTRDVRRHCVKSYLHETRFHFHHESF